MPDANAKQILTFRFEFRQTELTDWSDRCLKNRGFLTYFTQHIPAYGAVFWNTGTFWQLWGYGVHLGSWLKRAEIQALKWPKTLNLWSAICVAVSSWCKELSRGIQRKTSEFTVETGLFQGHG